MYSIHATKKLLDRVKQPIEAPVDEPTTILGNWYANALFWKPQVALLVNERTLFPVLMPLAPAATLGARFPETLGTMLLDRGMDPGFVTEETAAMSECRFTKTDSRSIVGVMNDFRFLAEAHRANRDVDDLVELSHSLAHTPTSPLRNRHGFPDLELEAVVAGWVADAM